MIAVIRDDHMQNCKTYMIEDGKPNLIGVLEFDEVDECYHCKTIDLETISFKSVQDYVQFLASKYDDVDTVQIMDDEQFSIFMS